MATRTTKVGDPEVRPVSQGLGRSPRVSNGTRAGRRGQPIKIVIDPEAPDIERKISDSKQTLTLAANAENSYVGRDPKSAAKRISQKIKSGLPPEPPKNPAFNPPAPIPFENTLAFAFRSSGGKLTAINGARLVDDERYRKLVWAFDTATDRDKDYVSLEDLCQAAEIPPDEFLGTVISSMYKRNIDIGKLTAMASHVKVVEATIQSATIPGPMGMPDRKMLLDHVGFLPKAGPGININMDSRTQVVSNGGSVEVSKTKGLPSFEDDGKLIHEAVRASERINLALPAPEEIKEAEFVDVPQS